MSFPNWMTQANLVLGHIMKLVVQVLIKLTFLKDILAEVRKTNVQSDNEPQHQRDGEVSTEMKVNTKD